MDTVLHDIIRENFDGAESALVWQFAIAETLTLTGEQVPASWQYRPSPFLSVMYAMIGYETALRDRAGLTSDTDDWSWEDARIAEYVLDARKFNRPGWADDLRHAGTVLARFVSVYGGDY